MERRRIIVVCGPTASGKTALAIEIAKRCDGEIVSADSMQIYKEMNIGTAKPDHSEMQGIPHHMLDVASVTEQYNVSRYVDEANQAIEGIFAKNKNVIIAGGTGLYIDSLINNINFFEIDNDYAYRNDLVELASEKGNIFVHGLLRKVDEPTADRLHPNDLKRVIRALEVYKVIGKTMSQIQLDSKRRRKFDPVFIGLDYKDRSVLYDRIEKRVQKMIDNGLENEARALIGLELSNTAAAAIGYKEMFEYIRGETTLETAVGTICKKTRNYAKRQLTWFRKNSEINWFDPPSYCYDINKITDDVLNVIALKENKNEAKI